MRGGASTYEALGPAASCFMFFYEYSTSYSAINTIPEKPSTVGNFLKAEKRRISFQKPKSRFPRSHTTSLAIATTIPPWGDFGFVAERFTQGVFRLRHHAKSHDFSPTLPKRFFRKDRVQNTRLCVQGWYVLPYEQKVLCINLFWNGVHTCNPKRPFSKQNEPNSMRASRDRNKARGAAHDEGMYLWHAAKNLWFYGFWLEIVQVRDMVGWEME